MDNFTIINLQALTGTIAILLGFRYWIRPRISKLPIHEALLPFVFLNIFRYLGLSFMAKEQFHDGFPQEFLTTVGLLDFTTAILAIISLVALKNKWRFAIPLVWIFNIVGFGDLVTAFPQFFGLKLYDYNLGFIWLMFITYGLAAFLSHIYIFIRLFRNLKKKSST
jgi:hypothetical protein